MWKTVVQERPSKIPKLSTPRPAPTLPPLSRNIFQDRSLSWTDDVNISNTEILATLYTGRNNHVWAMLNVGYDTLATPSGRNKALAQVRALATHAQAWSRPSHREMKSRVQALCSMLEVSSKITSCRSGGYTKTERPTLQKH